MLAKVKSLWFRLPDRLRRVIHTFYQTFLGVFLLGISGVLSSLLSTGDWNAAASALLSLAAAALAAAISAVKNGLATKLSI
jgi:hypothetical protein